MYLDWHKNIKKMSQEEKGLLVDLMYASYNREELPTIPEKFLVLDIFWDTIDSIIKRNLRDYDNKLDRQSDSPTDSPKTVNRQTTDNKPTTDTDTDTGTGTVTDPVTETGTVDIQVSNLNNEYIEGLTFEEYMEVEDEVFRDLNNENTSVQKEEVDRVQLWDKIINE